MEGAVPTNKREFEQALDELVMQAYRNDLSIANEGYALRHGDIDIPDFEIMVCHLTNHPTTLIN